MTATSRRDLLRKVPAVAAIAAVPTAALFPRSDNHGEGERCRKCKKRPCSCSPEKEVHWPGGEAPENPLFSPIVTFGNMVFLSGIGAHFDGDIKAHTKHVLDELEANLESVGSSMKKVLKVTVLLSTLDDYDGMNEVFLGRFGSEPGVRTTSAAAGVPGDSLVEMDCVAYI